MLSDRLRKRLAGMDRRPPTVEPDASPLKARLFRAARALERPHPGTTSCMTIDEAFGGREVATASGVFYLVEPDGQTLHAGIREIARRHRGLCRIDAVLPAYRDLLGPDPARVLYLDIETTGFSGVPLFLVGLMSLDDDRLRILQLLARDYSEEEALLEYLAERFADFTCMITFNGKTFDAPYIRDRLFANAVRCRFPERHLDLLAPSRRRWKTTLPDCRLQTLERWVCGRRREGDIPGMEIPDTYHRFVRTGDAAVLRPILVHNALDLITMGELIFYLVTPEEDE